jgi:hypothetical protein
MRNSLQFADDVFSNPQSPFRCHSQNHPESRYSYSNINPKSPFAVIPKIIPKVVPGPLNYK